MAAFRGGAEDEAGGVGGGEGQGEGLARRERGLPGGLDETDEVPGPKVRRHGNLEGAARVVLDGEAAAQSQVVPPLEKLHLPRQRQGQERPPLAISGRAAAAAAAVGVSPLGEAAGRPELGHGEAGDRGQRGVGELDGEGDGHAVVRGAGAPPGIKRLAPHLGQRRPAPGNSGVGAQVVQRKGKRAARADRSKAPGSAAQVGRGAAH
mmetsp:Transcript_31873/g.71760  ORF Transcript_31873/g.71760 Transcript_31873/m.71760 type:complete len:207 (-) Transcript_31873:470-1090(-)